VDQVHLEVLDGLKVGVGSVVLGARRGHRQRGRPTCLRPFYSLLVHLHFDNCFPRLLSSIFGLSFACEGMLALIGLNALWTFLRSITRGNQ
jgi:hypothetical protein